MIRPLLLAALLSTLSCTARAQAASVDPPADAPQQDPQPAPLQPFVATYQVFHDGRELGEATMQLTHVRWRRAGASTWA